MTSSDEGKNRGFVLGHHHESHPPPPPPSPSDLPPDSTPPAQYGTFQGVPSYPPPRPPPAVGFPHPAPPPGAVDTPAYPPSHGQYYAQGYQSVPGYAVAQGRPVHERRLPCCGIGLGWCLFIFGFFLAGIPWYVGAILMLCSRNVDYREKPGYVICVIAAVLETVAIILGVTKGADDHW